jgi:hypothetical protein
MIVLFVGCKSIKPLLALNGPERPTMTAYGSQAQFRHITILTLENKGFLKAQGTIYPIRRFWHDAS